MDCKSVRDILYDNVELSSPMLLFYRIQAAIHLLHCKDCTAHKNIIEKSNAIMERDFLLPVSAKEENEFCDSIMNVLSKTSQNVNFEKLDEKEKRFSIYVWALTGTVICGSLIAAFFNINILNAKEMNAFIVPLSITIGGIVTAYGAMFIVCHLKVLTECYNNFFRES
ncbi:MAG: hypothetical protein Ta2B_30380 [Termitinemataceae bacterium]|nr:MAG: hypothetical protein Ta2B_30380 [Termitinemataceae bacterium]